MRFGMRIGFKPTEIGLGAENELIKVIGLTTSVGACGAFKNKIDP
jgi:hypothetical protein